MRGKQSQGEVDASRINVFKLNLTRIATSKGSLIHTDRFEKAKDVHEMPRELRIEYVGAIYQVMNRGGLLEDIFLDDEDRRLFLKTLVAGDCAFQP